MKVLILVFVLFSFSNINRCIATEEFNAKEFINEVKSYSSEMFPEFSDENWISNILTR